MQKPQIKGNTIAIPSSQEFLQDVDLFIEGILRGFGVDESVIADVAISVSELVNNAISHGNKALRGTPVTATVKMDNSDIVISVSDSGTGFNPDDIEDPISDENLLKEVGRGIFIVRSLMDKVDFQATSDGTTVTITKATK